MKDGDEVKVAQGWYETYGHYPRDYPKLFTARATIESPITHPTLPMYVSNYVHYQVQ